MGLNPGLMVLFLSCSLKKENQCTQLTAQSHMGHSRGRLLSSDPGFWAMVCQSQWPSLGRPCLGRPCSQKLQSWARTAARPGLDLAVE